MSEKRDCCEKSWHGRIGFLDCARWATVERDGKWYCSTHDPVKVKERQAALVAKLKGAREHEEALRRLRHDLASAERAVIEAAEDWKSDSCEPLIRDARLVVALNYLEEAREALRKFKEETGG